MAVMQDDRAQADVEPLERFQEPGPGVVDRSRSPPRQHDSARSCRRARDEGRAWQRRLFDAGFAGIHWPIEFGGRGLTPEHNARWVTGVRRGAGAGVPQHGRPACSPAGALLAFGTPEQQAEHLPPIVTGERVWCQLFSEPDAGSDLASLSTRAERDGDQWVVNGQKVWCSNGRVADWGILMARTDPDAPSTTGISFFLVDMAVARRRGPAAAPDDRWRRVRRGVPHRRARPGGAPARARERRVAGRHGRRSPTSAGSSVPRASRCNGGSTRLGRRSAATSTPIAAPGRSSTSGSAAPRCGPWVSARVPVASVARIGGEARHDRAHVRPRRCSAPTSAGAAAMLERPAAYGLLSAPGGRIAGGTSQVQRNIIGERILGLAERAEGDQVARSQRRPVTVST